jgi:endonuclease/exonuclease/phosphatase (EEP) superfamily protein YafD
MHSISRNHNIPNIIKILAFLLVVLIGCLTLLSIINLWAWHFLFELASHFKLQYLFFSLFLLAFLAFFKQKNLLLIALFCISIQLADIGAWYFPQNKAEIETAGKLQLLSLNINVQNQSYSQVTSLVRKEKPDLAIFMEIDEIWVKKFKSFVDILPYAYTKPNPYNLGIAVYSKQPLKNVSFNLFGTPNNPSILGKLTINGQVISLIATHPLPPARLDYFHLRNKQLDEINKYVKSLKTPVIMAGDLNITMWSPYYKRFEQKTGLRNARKGFGILPTWPTKPTFSRIPRFLSPLLWIPLDHCLVSPEIRVANIRTKENIGSDHLPLSVELIIPKIKTKAS